MPVPRHSHLESDSSPFFCSISLSFVTAAAERCFLQLDFESFLPLLDPADDLQRTTFSKQGKHSSSPSHPEHCVVCRRAKGAQRCFSKPNKKPIQSPMCEAWPGQARFTISIPPPTFVLAPSFPCISTPLYAAAAVYSFHSSARKRKAEAGTNS
jgi:hypothetical protein